MNTVPVFSTPLCSQIEHDPYHPEAPSRVARLLASLKEEAGPWELQTIDKPLRNTDAWPPHPPHYWSELAKSIEANESYFHEPDTRIGPSTFELLAAAAGTVSEALKCALTTEQKRVFAAVRPASHHASADRAMGFCLLNLAAFAAYRARERFNLKRIAILDIDAHHGNGTDSITQDDPSLLFISLHQHPYYPFTGEARGSLETATKGQNLSIEMPASAGLQSYQHAFVQTILPAIKAFEAELLILSTGFDAHTLDPMSELSLESEDFGYLTRETRNAIDCPILSLLEGGYYIPALIDSAKSHLRALA
ncbi:MAG: histone deacetylase [Verrucomicrobiota bacterium]